MLNLKLFYFKLSAITDSFLGVRAGFSFQSFCSGEEQKGFSLQSLTQNLSRFQNSVVLMIIAHHLEIASAFLSDWFVY